MATERTILAEVDGVAVIDAHNLVASIVDHIAESPQFLTNLYRWFKSADAGESPLDPLSTQMDKEPRFPLMGRDPLAPGLVRLYADIREGKYEHCAALLDVVIRKARTRTVHPTKDAKHAWSARAIAGEMEDFYNESMRGEMPEGRVNDEPFGPQPEPPATKERDSYADLAPTDAGAIGEHLHLEEIKKAHPAPEPDEGT